MLNVLFKRALEVKSLPLRARLQLSFGGADGRERQHTTREEIASLSLDTLLSWV